MLSLYKSISSYLKDAVPSLHNEQNPDKASIYQQT